ncbi:BCCT family transporter [Sediminivirga luteola]|uniref:BCCT family transporter n=1 Tax=Sediminivirga luteola TaxID=1774748 RepID=UPI001F597E29|nr:BCCT family transporter [Sediminivirga luteola]MCI2265257.1 BCCT family transporter [Sediminivirga luteola]
MAGNGSERTLSHWNVVKVWKGINKPVFLTASLLIFGLLVFALIYGRSGGEAFDDLLGQIANGVGWWYVLIVTLFVVFALYCGISRIGSIRLGRDDEGPEFSLLSWFTMLFSAGMGIGLVFYGVAEPLSHYITPPEAGGIEGGTDAAVGQAMDLTVFHWGLHAWAIYVVVGLGLAYMTFRKGRPLSIRWLLEPVFGRRLIEGWLGHLIDTVAIVGTLFGVATSLGFGAEQIMAGLGYLGWAERSNWLILVLIGGITGIAVFSVVSGVYKGLKWLSNINMLMAAALMLFVLFAGATLFLMQSWVQNLGGYVSSLPDIMLRTAPLTDDGWAAGWTIFYWGWWISWAPFVGMFVARISRGRTIREFVAGVLIAPTLVGTIWFTVFGDSGILRQRQEGDMLVDGEVDANTSLFQLLGTLPVAGFVVTVTSVVAMLVIVFFFVTSSDSGSLVIDVLATGGDVETPRLTRLYWALLQGVAAALLLLVGGDSALTALQTFSIATAIPFSVVMVIACVALLRAFHYEANAMPRYVSVRPVGEAAELAASGMADAASPGAVATSSEPAASAAARRRRWNVSATFAGLDYPPVREAVAAAPEPVALAVTDIPTHAIQVDPETGAVSVDEEKTLTDPLGGEVFDTPEFDASAEGQAHRVDQLNNGGDCDAAAGTADDPVVPDAGGEAGPDDGQDPHDRGGTPGAQGR